MKVYGLRKTSTQFTDRSIRNYKKRVAQLKGRLLLLGLLISILFVASGFFGKYMVKAQSTDETNTYKYYTYITIEYGENLWTIAEENMGTEYKTIKTYINEILHINNLEDANSIMTGQTIIIPYYSTEFK